MGTASAARTDAGHFARYVSILWRYYGSRVSRAPCEETIRMAHIRRGAETIRVVRARPHVTGGGKVLPLHHSAPGRS